MMDLHRKLYRFHMLLKGTDAHTSHLGETRVGSCLVVLLVSRNLERESKTIFSKNLGLIGNN